MLGKNSWNIKILRVLAYLKRINPENKKGHINARIPLAPLCSVSPNFHARVTLICQVKADTGCFFAPLVTRCSSQRLPNHLKTKKTLQDAYILYGSTHRFDAIHKCLVLSRVHIMMILMGKVVHMEKNSTVHNRT